MPNWIKSMIKRPSASKPKVKKEKEMTSKKKKYGKKSKKMC